MCPTDPASRGNERGAARRWRQVDREHRAALRRNWRAANLDRDRELNRLSERRRRARIDARNRHNERGRLWYAEHRDVALERSRRFREAHPEKVREYQRRYKERHPERARENAAKASRRYRDRHAAEVREGQRRTAAERRERTPNEYRDWYAANLAQQRERGRLAAQRRSRLKQLGLPPRSVRRVYADQRRANDSAANQFFESRRTPEQRGAIAAEVLDDYRLGLPEVVAVHRRRLVREARRSALDVVKVRAASTPQAIEAAYRSVRLKRLRERHEHDVHAVRESLPGILEQHRVRREARLREEIRMDSIARELRGAQPYDAEKELESRLTLEATTEARAKLLAIRDRTIRTARSMGLVYGPTVDQAAPHRATGGVGRPDVGPGVV